MEVTDAQVFEIIEQSQVSDARRRILNVALNSGLDEKAQNRISLICTELATNLLKHPGKGGQLLVQAMNDNERCGMEIYSIDSGRGMDTDDCMLDGVSSSGTLGTGLGAVKRMSDEFHIFSVPGAGTVVHTRIWTAKPPRNGVFSSGGLTVPKPGEQLSGDKWLIVHTDAQIYCMVIDGLGHGIEASDASNLAKKRFRENIMCAPAEIIKCIHTSLRGTRGAVGAVARLDINAQRLDYCGLGNITGMICTVAGRKHLVSMNGTLGYECQKVNEYSRPWTNDSMLIMHSDGLSGRISDTAEALESMPAPLAAGWLYQQQTRFTDDATVLVLKQMREK